MNLQNGYGRRVFDIQNAKLAKAFRLEGEGFKPSKWKNKSAPPYGISY
jgi:hypothetical protein